MEIIHTFENEILVVITSANKPYLYSPKSCNFCLFSLKCAESWSIKITNVKPKYTQKPNKVHKKLKIVIFHIFQNVPALMQLSKHHKCVYLSLTDQYISRFFKDFCLALFKSSCL